MGKGLRIQIEKNHTLIGGENSGLTSNRGAKTTCRSE